MIDAEDTVFLLPGPVKMHPRVLRAMSAPALNHRGPEFKAVLEEMRPLLRYLFGTQGEVAVLSGSGTAGLEAAVSGLLRKEDKVLNLVNGKFSERFHDLCKVFASPTALAFDWGTPVDPAKVAEALDGGGYRAVTLCWNETSTGLTNPIGDVAKVVRERDLLLIVDGITAVGGLENRMDLWGIDALVMGSQKCLAAPAGLSAVALSKRAAESLHALVMGSQKCLAAPAGLSAVALSKRAAESLHSETSFYTNLKAHVEGLKKQDTPYTPGVPLYLAFLEALRMLKEEGLERRIARTRRLAEAARAGVLELECELYPDPAYASDTVTAIRYPPGVDDAKFRTILREEHRVILAGGQSQLKGKIFRIGHMGICSFGDLAAGFLGIEGALAALGHRFDRGDSVEAIAKRA